MGYDKLLPAQSLVPWCSGLTCGPVKAEIAGSNPVGAAKVERKTNQKGWFFIILCLCSSQKIGLFLCYAPRGRKIVVFYRSRDFNSCHLLYISEIGPVSVKRKFRDICQDYLSTKSLLYYSQSIMELLSILIVGIINNFFI
jgi:hypothetical protein